MTVLVLADQFDVTADRVIVALHERGVPVFRCDVGDFPRRLTLAATLEAGDWWGLLRNDHRELHLEDVRSVWYRRPTHFRFPDEMSPTERRLAAGEARMGFGGVLTGLPALFVRVTVVGEVVHAAAIHARSEESMVDWRADYSALEYDVLNPPEDVREGMMAFMRHFGLTFGGFDFVIDQDGRWWFLECNSGAQFGWLDAAAGLRISDSLADLLARGLP